MTFNLVIDDSLSEDISDYGMDEFYSEPEFIEVSSTIGPCTILTVQRNSKKILTPSDLCIYAPAANDWIEIEQEPEFGEIKMSEDGQEMTTQQVQGLMDGNIIYQAGPNTGRDVVKFKVIYHHVIIP